MSTIKLITPFILFIFYSQITVAQNTLPAPVGSGVLMEKFSELRGEEKYEEALQTINLINVGDTNYANALLNKIYCLIDMKKYDEAIENCELGMSLEPRQQYQVFRLNKGYVLNLQEKGKEALEEYKALKAEFPFYRNVSNNIAYQYLALEKYDSSYAAYKEHAMRYPYDESAHFNLGVYAYNQSNFTEAFMALNMVILLKPYSERAYNVLSLLNEFSNNTNTKKTPKEGFKLESDEYSELDLLIENYVALDKKYKVDTKSGLYLAKQNHLIFKQLGEMEVTDYFFSKYYAPFYTKVMEEGWYDEMQHFELIPSTNETHKKIVAKEMENLKKFNTWFRNVWYEMNNTITVDFENVKGENTLWFNNSGGIEAIGGLNKETDMLEGPMVYLFSNGQVQSKGNYKNDSRDGSWQFYRENGLLKQDINYKEGVLMGSATLYNEAGEISEKVSFKDGKREGAFEENYLHGKTYRKGTYKEGKFDGAIDYFYSGGSPEYKGTYANGKLTGTLTEYYSNGQIYRTEEFVDGKSEGNYLLFWPNGDKRAIGTTSGGDLTGKYESFYQDNKPEQVGNYSGGLKTGEWKEFDRNGKLVELSNYDKGELEGNHEEYDYDGVLMAKKVFENGYLVSYQYFDKNNQLLSEGGHKKKVFTINNYYANGVLSSTGGYQAGVGKVGEWKDYDEYGNLSAEYSHLNGETDGELIFYYPWGSKKKVVTYKEGKEEGKYVEYYPHGKMEYQGYYTEGKVDGVWEAYHPDGSLEVRKFYQNGKLAGQFFEYGISGKLDYIADYEFKVLNGATYYDTSGKVLNSFDFKNGAGTYERNHFNGKADFRGEYTLDASQGDYVWKLPNGEVKTKGFYKEDRKDGKWQWFHENGELSEEGVYLNNFKEGKWVNYHDNGKIDEVFYYTYGKRHGENVEYYYTGKKQNETTYEYGKIHGDYIFYDESEEIQLARSYKYGLYDSYYYFNASKEKVVFPIEKGSAVVKAKYHNGNPSREFTLKNGYFDGDYKIYHFNGNLADEYQLEFDERHGPFKSYFSNAKLKLDRNYYYGYIHGVSTEYYESGKKKSMITYRYGVKHGPSIDYNEDGSIKKEKEYFNGREI